MSDPRDENHEFSRIEPLPAGESAQRKCAECGLLDTNPVHS
jgi:hypothetical protein